MQRYLERGAQWRAKAGGAAFAAPQQPRLRSLFLSDLHLGARGSKAGQIAAFLQAHPAETLYLVGDVLDIWHIRPQWGQPQDEVLGLILAMAEAGRRVVYLTGNHDAALRADDAVMPPGIELCDRILHHTADGRRYLVLHGDCVDARVFRSHLSTRIGALADNGLRRLDGWLRWLSFRARGEEERSVILGLIATVTKAMALGRGYERRLVALAAGSGADGVICGHFHKPALHDDHGLTYANCGDWVDNMTALAETQDGRLQLLEWAPEAVAAPQPTRIGALTP